MDALFLLPQASVAMPRAYWLTEPQLSSQLVLIEPSEFEFKRILEALKHLQLGDYDMEIVNQLYSDSCTILPHRRYNLLSGEFRSKEHHRYLGSKEEVWGPQKALDEAKYVHFSDWPLPKPWLAASESQVNEMQPKCTDSNCKDREIWIWLYSDFRSRRSVGSIQVIVFCKLTCTS